MIKHKSKILTILIFIVINIAIYFATALNEKQRVETALAENLNKLETHFKVLLYHQKLISDAQYIATITAYPTIEILTKVQTASKSEKAVLRDKLYNLLKGKYEILKKENVLQYHFILPNNHSFLRMHKPDKFGDDLSTVRLDFAYTNKTKEPISGFVQGKVAHGFRNVYPIFNNNGLYLGAMEISFASDTLQKYLTNISKIHTHFLVNKDIFDAKVWKRDNFISNYVESSENSNFMLTLSSEHTKKRCIIDNYKKLESVKDRIYKNMEKGEKFSLYILENYDYTEIISFIPIKDFASNKRLGWIVSYEKNIFIYKTLAGNFIIRIILFSFMLIVSFLIYKQLDSQYKVKQSHKLLNDILNSTSSIMFITDFKHVIFSNKQFRDFFKIEDQDVYTKNITLLNLLVHINDYLAKHNLRNIKDFSEHFQRLSVEKRDISILNTYNKVKIFNIDITRTESTKHSYYLIILTDITEIKEKEILIHKKAYIDNLTGVYNRNKFDEVTNKELIREKRYGRGLCLAIIDIDHFKNFNDNFGHLIGDEVLKMLAKYLNTNIRETDTFARWGGEEFVILFPDTLSEDANLICDKLRIGVANLSHKTAGGITASFGVTQFSDEDSLDTMFKRCDDALYQAKKEGRNRVCIK